MNIAFQKDGSIISSPIQPIPNSDHLFPINSIDVPTQLRARKEKFPERPVQISGSESTPVDQILKILAHCKQAGINNVSFSVADKARTSTPPGSASARSSTQAAQGTPAAAPRSRTNPNRSAGAPDSSARSGRTTTRPTTVRVSYSLSAPIPGSIVEVSVAPNAKVKKGQALVKLDTSDAEVAIQIAEARVEEAKADYTVQETVLHGSLKKIERLKNLAARNLITTGELEDAELLADKSRALIDKARATLDIAIAQLQQAKINLDRHIVRAPADGTASLLHAHPGQHISPGDPLVSFKPANKN